ncbi:putative gtpase activating protein rga6 [Phaeomoniella chlamydospora]|uniref:Putative gtpase activating protein rga6 n=1 Tax=Phaeomoniella chlamydospora TaxID=158046 RepID=A0A0G2G6P3_PHACM|nr:putative gtpase activating protein rga6 [Phaeomoniella chlamydospora]
MPVDASAHKIFCTPINQRLVTLYCSTFTDLLKGVQGGATIVATVAGNRFPQTKKLSNFDKADRPAEVGAALFKMLEDLPIGVMGSVTMFDSIHQALRIWDDGRTELARTESLPLARFIAKIISKIPDILQLHLLCAIFGFMHGLNKQDSDTEILAQVLAPVMLNSKMDEIGLSQNETTKTDRMRQVKQTCRKLLGLPAKETQKLKKLEICKYVAAGLISIWAPIMKQMKELEGDTPVLDDVQTPRSGGTTAHGSES